MCLSSETDHVELEGFYRTMILSPDDVDLDKVFALTSEIIALEVVNRICITIVEVHWNTCIYLYVNIKCQITACYC